MKKKLLFRALSLVLILVMMLCAVSVVSYAEPKEYVSIGDTVLYRGEAPDVDSFETVYYKNGVGKAGSEADYNAKLEFDAQDGFILTLNGLDVGNSEGAYSIFADCDLYIVILSDSKITHTVHTNTKDRFAIYVSGELTVSGDSELDVYLRGDCNFDELDFHAVRAHSTSGLDKINACDGRSEQEKQIDSIRDEFEHEINKTNYELALAKLNFANTAERLNFETRRAKNIAIAAVVIGSVSLIANGVIATVLVINRKKGEPDFDEDEE